MTVFVVDDDDNDDADTEADAKLMMMMMMTETILTMMATIINTIKFKILLHLYIKLKLSILYFIDFFVYCILYIYQIKVAGEIFYQYYTLFRLKTNIFWVSSIYKKKVFLPFKKSKSLNHFAYMYRNIFFPNRSFATSLKRIEGILINIQNEWFSVKRFSMSKLSTSCPKQSIDLTSNE